MRTKTQHIITQSVIAEKEEGRDGYSVWQITTGHLLYQKFHVRNDGNVIVYTDPDGSLRSVFDRSYDYGDRVDISFSHCSFHADKKTDKAIFYRDPEYKEFSWLNHSKDLGDRLAIGALNTGATHRFHVNKRTNQTIAYTNLNDRKFSWLTYSTDCGDHVLISIDAVAYVKVSKLDNCEMTE